MSNRLLLAIGLSISFLHIFSQQSQYYHYTFGRKLQGFSISTFANDTLECIFKNGIDSQQIIVIKNKNLSKTWCYVNDTVYYSENNLWKYTIEEYKNFSLKAGKMLFTPLLNNGESFKKHLEDSNFNILFTDTVINTKSCLKLLETSNSKQGAIDSVSLTIYFQNGLPIKSCSYILTKPLYQKYDINILTIDSNEDQIKTVLDSVLKCAQNSATPFIPIYANKESRSQIDTLSIIQEYIKKEKLDLNNKIIVIDLWYCGCTPCIRSIPSLNELSERKDIFIIGLNMMDDSMAKLNIVSFPTVIVFNPLNREYRFQIGYNEENNIGEIRKLIDSVK